MDAKAKPTPIVARPAPVIRGVEEIHPFLIVMLPTQAKQDEQMDREIGEAHRFQGRAEEGRDDEISGERGHGCADPDRDTCGKDQKG